MNPAHTPGGTFTTAEGLTLTRMWYGAMQLAGPRVWGPPADRDEAIRVLRAAVEAGVNHSDTADFYGPHVTNEIIREALTAPEAAGERFVAGGDWVWMADVSGVLRSALGADAKKAPARGAPDLVLRIVGLFDRPLRFIIPTLWRKHAVTAAKAQAVLGWKSRPTATTLVDCAPAPSPKQEVIV